MPIIIEDPEAAYICLACYGKRVVVIVPEEVFWDLVDPIDAPVSHLIRKSAVRLVRDDIDQDACEHGSLREALIKRSQLDQVEAHIAIACVYSQLSIGCVEI